MLVDLQSSYGWICLLNHQTQVCVNHRPHSFSSRPLAVSRTGEAGWPTGASLQAAFHGDVLPGQPGPLPPSSSCQTQQPPQEETQIYLATSQQARDIWWACKGAIKLALLNLFCQACGSNSDGLSVHRSDSLKRPAGMQKTRAVCELQWSGMEG